MDQLSTAYSNQGHYQRTERQIYKEPKKYNTKMQQVMLQKIILQI